MADRIAESLGGLRTIIEEEAKEAIYETAKRFENLLRFKIDSEWYSRSGYEDTLDETPNYTRTFQLQSAVTTKKSDKEVGAYVFIDPDKIEPVMHDQPFHSYMSVDKQTTWKGKKLTELVPEWIEYGNRYLPASHVHQKTEQEIIKRDLHEKGLISELKARGIDAQKV